jgi:putative transposase
MPLPRIALEGPGDGRPRITAEWRRGWTVTATRVHRLLREDRLRGVRPRQWVVTPDSNHGGKVDPNLARARVRTGMDPLGRAALTSSRRRQEFVFWAVILDAFSRPGIGWALEGNLE